MTGMTGSMKPACAVLAGIGLLMGITMSGAVSVDAADVKPVKAWPGVWLVHHEEPDSKTVVVEFERFLALVESPGDDAVARGMLMALDEAFPDQPVRFVVHTHPHGHSLGAVDPYLTRGITIVTSEGNLERVLGRSADPDRFDRVALVVGDGFAIEDGMNRMVVHVIDHDRYGVPSEGYTVVELPRVGVMVSGCLYNKPVTHHAVVNERKPALWQYLRDHAPSVTTLVPTNTTSAGGYEDVCTVAMLEETLEQGLRPDVVADRLTAMTLEEIEQHLDELAVEYRAVTPSAYDLMVCASTLKRQREDPERAALFMEVACRAFPDDPDPASYLGRLRWEMGQKDRAEASWARALELTVDRRDRADLEVSIARVRTSG
jgi:hypothetical protein